MSTHHWQVTIRAADDSGDLGEMVRVGILPLVRASGSATHVALAACVHCPGEFTFMADWSSAEAVEALEASGAYQAQLEALRPRLRVAPRRELWRLLEPATEP